jgi:serine/threonine-protein kinase
MITGKVPFDRPNSVNILMAHVNEEAPPMRQMNPAISLSPAIEETVGRCMAKDPDQRFRSMDEVLAALKRVGGGTLTATISGAGTGEYRSLSGSGSGPQMMQGGTPGSGPNPAFLSPSGSDPGSIPSPLSVPSDSPAAGAPLVSQPPARSGSKGTLVAAVVSALALAGIVGYVALRPSKPAAGTSPTPSVATVDPTAPPPATAAAPDTAPPATATAPAPPTLVKLRINTDPDSASVREDGVENCSSTPCDIVYKGPDADPSKDHHLVITRTGYRNETRTVRIGDSPVTVKLTPAPASYRPPPPTKPAETQTLPPGYKPDIPY